MTDDIVTRLRGQRTNGVLCAEAADEIERLQAGLDELRHAVIQLRFERNEAADEIERLRAEAEHVADLLWGFVENTDEHKSATMFILHRAVSKIEKPVKP